MIEEKHRLLKNGVNITDIKELDEQIDATLDHIIDEFDYEPENKEGLSKALRSECYNHIFEFAESSERDIEQNFYGVKSDFDGAPSGCARSTLSIIIGSRSAKKDDPKDVSRDIVHISNIMMEQKYG